MMLLHVHHPSSYSYILMLHMAIQLELSFPGSLAASCGRGMPFQGRMNGIGVGSSMFFI